MLKPKSKRVRLVVTSGVNKTSVMNNRQQKVHREEMLVKKLDIETSMYKMFLILIKYIYFV